VPELPEITAHAERLDEAFRGAVLARFEPLHLSALKTFDPNPKDAVGQGLTGVGHRGKYLLLAFGEELTFVVHLMQGGRLRPDPKQSRKPRGGMARWVFDDGGALLLSEAGTERRAGVWLVRGDATEVAPLTDLGPDASLVTPEEFADALLAERTRLHGFLRRQGPIAGIGRLLANEILHTAKLSPFALTTSLTPDQVAHLHAVIVSVVDAATAHERTLSEIGKSAERPNRVHHRVGDDCEVCGDVVRSVEYKRYTVAYCATCQTDGKVLADNTTSKFLK